MKKLIPALFAVSFILACAQPARADSIGRDAIAGAAAGQGDETYDRAYENSQCPEKFVSDLPALNFVSRGGVKITVHRQCFWGRGQISSVVISPVPQESFDLTKYYTPYVYDAAAQEFVGYVKATRFDAAGNVEMKLKCSYYWADYCYRLRFKAEGNSISQVTTISDPQISTLRVSNVPYLTTLNWSKAGEFKAALQSKTGELTSSQNDDFDYRIRDQSIPAEKSRLDPGQVDKAPSKDHGVDSAM